MVYNENTAKLLFVTFWLPVDLLWSCELHHSLREYDLCFCSVGCDEQNRYAVGFGVGCGMDD